MLTGPPIRQQMLRDDGFLLNPWLQWVNSLYGIVTGRQAARAATSVNAGARKDVDVTWAVPYKDTNYTASAVIEDTSAAGAGLRVERIRAKTASKITVQVINDTAGALSGTVHGMAAHD